MTANSPAPPRRRWFRLSLRGMMLLILLIGGGIIWPILTIRTERQAINAIQAAGGQVRFDYLDQLDISGLRHRTEPAAPRWVRRLLGDELFQNVKGVTLRKPVDGSILANLAPFRHLEGLAIHLFSGGEEFRRLREFPRLHYLNLQGPGVNDEALGEISRLPAMDRLLIFQAPATDAGFARLESLSNLNTLTIDLCPNLTDDRAASLVAKIHHLTAFQMTEGTRSRTATLAALIRHHPGLEFLTLDFCDLTDDDLQSIGHLTRLRALSMQGAGVSDDGLASLKSLVNLENLMVASPRISDQGLVSLHSLRSLRDLSVDRTQVTDVGVATLQQALPLLNPVKLPINLPAIIPSPGN